MKKIATSSITADFDLGRVCYLMAPMTIYRSTGKYLACISILQERFPEVQFLRPDLLYASKSDRKAKLDHVIALANSGILLSDDGVIGYGCLTEIELLLSCGKPIFYFANGKLWPLDSISIFPIPPYNWKRYAEVIINELMSKRELTIAVQFIPEGELKSKKQKTEKRTRITQIRKSWITAFHMAREYWFWTLKPLLTAS